MEGLEGEKDKRKAEDDETGGPVTAMTDGEGKG